MIELQLTGIFPRSNELIKATRSYDKGLISWNELLEYIKKDAQYVINLQIDMGFDCIIDGMYLWQDIFRPFTEGVKGIKPGALTRWFDNNTFFRKPLIGEIDADTHIPFIHRYILLDLMMSPCKKVILPGPYTFLSLSSRGYDENTIISLAKIMAREVENLENKGVRVFQFNEPSLVYRESPDKVFKVFESLREAYEIIRKKAEGKIILHTYFGNAAPIMNELLDLPVDYIGVDFYSTEFMDLKEISLNKGLLCGCLDSRNSYMGDPLKVVELVKKIEEHMNPKEIILAPNCDLEFLPREIAIKKMKILVNVKKLLEGDHNV